MKKLLLALLLSTGAFAKDIVLTSKNTVYLNGNINEFNVNRTIKELQNLNSQDQGLEPIYLILRSSGGSIINGIELINYMKKSVRPVHTISLKAASMAFVISQFGNQRYITDNGFIMHHPPSLGIRESLPKIRVQVNFAQQLSDMLMTEILQRNVKFNKESFEKLIDSDYYSLGVNAVNDGFIDEIVNISCDVSLNTETPVIASLNNADVFLLFPNCPLLYFPKILNTQNEVIENYEKINKLVEEYLGN